MSYEQAVEMAEKLRAIGYKVEGVFLTSDGVAIALSGGLYLDEYCDDASTILPPPDDLNMEVLHCSE